MARTGCDRPACAVTAAAGVVALGVAAFGLATSGCSAPLGLQTLVERAGSPLAPIETNDAAADPDAAAPLPDAFVGDHWIANADWRPDRDFLPPRVADELPTHRWRWARDDFFDPATLTDGDAAAGSSHREALASLARWADHPTPAILRVHRDEGTQTEPLRRAVFDDALSESTRAAAAEAWTARVNQTAVAERDWAAIAAAAADRSLPQTVRAELLRGLRVAPQRAPVLIANCKPDAPQPLTLAAVDACVRFTEESIEQNDYPLGLESLITHPDPAVRMRVGVWAARVGHPETLDWLQRQQQDVNPRVQTAAVVSLGHLAQFKPRAVQPLIEAARDDASEAIRAAAVLASAIADPSQPPRGRSDTAATVRRVVARVANDADTLGALVADSDREVQRAAMRSAATLPTERAVPVLLAAIENGMLETRQAARDSLLERTETDPASLPAAVLLDPAEQRRKALRTLARIEGWSARPVSSKSAVATERAVVVDAVETLLADPNDADAWRILETLTTADLPTLERTLRDEPASRADWPRLWDELLPAVRDDFAALADLRSRSPKRRAAGAWRLAGWGETRSVSPLVLARLPATLRREQNANVWRGIAQALHRESGPHVEAVFRLAMQSPWADVRELACRFIARQRDPRLAETLRPLLVDESEAVRLAAIEAAGRCGQPSLRTTQGEALGLRDLRSDASRSVRQAVTTALFRLGDDDAVQELLRLLHEPDRSRQLEAAAVLRESPPQAIGPAVVSIAWTERDARVRAALLELLAALDPAAAAWPAAADDLAKLSHWKQVHAGRIAKTAATPGTGG